MPMSFSGVIRAVGSEIFNQRVRLEMISTEECNLGEGLPQDHVIFTVFFLDDDSPTNTKNDERNENETTDTSSIQVVIKGYLNGKSNSISRNF